jgi:hypothetical protein
MPIKTATNFEEIVFNPDYHSYTYHGAKLRSVTAALKEFQPAFDKPTVAKRVAEKSGKTVTEVLADWEARGKVALVNGNRVHKHIEETLNGKIPAGVDPFLIFNERLPEMTAFDRLWEGMQQIVRPLYVEWVVGDFEWGLGGTVDALVVNEQTGLFHIWDWKTGKFDTSNAWENLLPPFQNYDACKLNVYSLQTSLYRLIIERNTGLSLGDSYIIHLSEDGRHNIHPATDFRQLLADFFDYCTF